MENDYECSICYGLFFNPVTTECSHTFCARCLDRFLDHSPLCPLCRTVIPFRRKPSLNESLATRLKETFPEQYETRRVETEAEERKANRQMPLFVLDCGVFPGCVFPMHIFEPRYRLMLRRCLGGSRRFAIVGSLAACQYIGRNPELQTSDREAGFAIGCVVEVRSHTELPDGRSFIELIGRHLCRIEKYDILDGYAIGEVQPLPEPEDATSPEALELAAIGRQSVARLRQRLNQPDFLEDEPAPEEGPARFAYWLSQILVAIQLVPGSTLMRVDSIVRLLQFGTAALESQVIWS